MSAQHLRVDKGEQRFNRAVIAAGAAVAVAVAGSAYAVYRAQAVIRGMKENYETTTSLYRNPDELQSPAEKK